MQAHLGLLSRTDVEERVRERKQKLELRIKLRDVIKNKIHEHRDIETKRTIKPMPPMFEADLLVKKKHQEERGL